MVSRLYRLIKKGNADNCECRIDECSRNCCKLCHKCGAEGAAHDCQLNSIPYKVEKCIGNAVNYRADDGVNIFLFAVAICLFAEGEENISDEKALDDCTAEYYAEGQM